MNVCSINTWLSVIIFQCNCYRFIAAKYDKNAPTLHLKTILSFMLRVYTIAAKLVLGERIVQQMQILERQKLPYCIIVPTSRLHISTVIIRQNSC